MVGFYHLFVLFLISNKTIRLVFRLKSKGFTKLLSACFLVQKQTNLWPKYGYLFQFIPANVSVLDPVFFGPYQSQGKWVLSFSNKHINICGGSDFVVGLLLLVVTVVVIGHLGILSNPAPSLLMLKYLAQSYFLPFTKKCSRMRALIFNWIFNIFADERFCWLLVVVSCYSSCDGRR